MANGKVLTLDAFSENRPKHKYRESYKYYKMYVNGVEGKWRMLRTNKYKLIYIPKEKGEDFELYDIQKDPEEKNNVISNPPEDITLLKEKLLNYVNLSNKGRYQNKVEIDKKTQEDLKSLGYIE